MKKVFIIAMPFSISTERWLTALQQLPMEIHFFSSFQFSKPRFDFGNIIYHDYTENVSVYNKNNFEAFDFPFQFHLEFPRLAKFMGKAKRKFFGKEYGDYLRRAIERVQPDIVHTLESQHAGYLLDSALKNFGLVKNFRWIHSTWGIDIHYFGSFPEHRRQLISLFKNVDDFCSEGQRDLTLAEKLGYCGKTYIFPSVGGYFEIDNCNTNPSQRKIILLKGYQNEMRRGLNGLIALKKANLPKQFHIIVYGATPLVKEYVKNTSFICRVEIKDKLSHEEMIALAKKAIISLTNNLSDGLPNSFIEAMACGAFPIQSNTSMANEWIENGVTGFLVDPEDIDQISKAITLSISNPDLLDNAAKINRNIFENAFNKELILARMRLMYFNED